MLFDGTIKKSDKEIHPNYVSALCSPSVIGIPQLNMMTVQPPNVGTCNVKKINEKFLKLTENKSRSV